MEQNTSRAKPSRYGSREERNAYEKELRLRNPEFAERQRENTRQWVNRNRARKRASNKEYHESGKYRAKFLARWGLTPEDEPKNCQICGCGAGNRALPLDHDYITGMPRGFLCQQCNIGIGHFKDNLELLQRAIEYLKYPPLTGKGHPQIKKATR